MCLEITPGRLGAPCGMSGIKPRLTACKHLTHLMHCVLINCNLEGGSEIPCLFCCFGFDLGTKCCSVQGLLLAQGSLLADSEGTYWVQKFNQAWLLQYTCLTHYILYSVFIIPILKLKYLSNKFSTYS